MRVFAAFISTIVRLPRGGFGPVWRAERSINRGRGKSGIEWEGNNGLPTGDIALSHWGNGDLRLD